ncbi:MAG: P-II family nitrogen regulator, partial [Clostridia bacterium]|nr:P-II family nitrogen regulator [Clostridia bacterium]
DNGVAFTVPVDAIGGISAKKYLLGEDEIVKGEEEMDLNNTKCVLILTIVDKGNTDLVMDAAREVGASGGTVVKAKGTGADIAKLFGMAISEEKELIYIVSSREKRNDIMYAIMEKAGPKTAAHGITFSLPVDNVLGIKSLEKLFN